MAPARKRRPRIKNQGRAVRVGKATENYAGPSGSTIYTGPSGSTIFGNVKSHIFGQYFAIRSLDLAVKFLHPLRSKRVRDEQSGSALHKASSVNLPHPPRSSAVSAGIPRLCWPLSMAARGKHARQK